MKVNHFKTVLLYTILFASFFFDISLQQTVKLLHKEEGVICRQRNGLEPERVCINAHHCQLLIDRIKSQKYHNDFEICSFNGNTPIVCCPSSVMSEIKDKRSFSARKKCDQYTKIVSRITPSATQKDKNEFSILVVGGSKTKRNEFPHMVLLGYGLTANEGKWGCGGSLISEKWILTAGHCLQMGPSKASWARLGIQNIHDTVGEDRRIVQHVVHERYKPPSRYNDIALFRLENYVKFSESIKPICLNSDQLLNPETQIATGWGRTATSDPTSDDLLKVDLNIVPINECNSSYFSNNNRKQLEFGITPDSMICAGSDDGEKDTCLGDSGGPLQTKNVGASGLYTQFGVISFGKFCGDKTSPGVYTRVSKYISWIENIVWPM